MRRRGWSEHWSVRREYDWWDPRSGTRLSYGFINGRPYRPKPSGKVNGRYPKVRKVGIPYVNDIHMVRATKRSKAIKINLFVLFSFSGRKPKLRSRGLVSKGVYSRQIRRLGGQYRHKNRR